MNGMIHEWTYGPNMDASTQADLRDQQLYNALARYNYFQFFTQGRIAIFYSVQKLDIGGMTILLESMLLHVTESPCVPMHNGHADYSYILTQDDDLEIEKYAYLAERYDH
jgi:hypothetical protein